MYQTPDENKLILETANRLILKELPAYLIKEDIIDQIQPESLPADAEAGMVNKEKLRLLIGSRIVKDLKKILPDAEDFIARKFIQLIKLIKDKEPLYPDIFCEYILLKIARSSKRADSGFPSAEWEDLALEFLGEYDGGGSEYYEEEKKAFLSAEACLGNMYFADTEYGFEFLTWDADFELLDDYGLIKGLHTYLALGYEDSDLYKIFTSIGYNVPVQVAAVTELK